MHPSLHLKPTKRLAYAPQATLRGSDEASCFKYQLLWHMPTQPDGLARPKALYSMDTPAERNLYLPGANRECRYKFIELFRRLPAEALPFFATVYPQYYPTEGIMRLSYSQEEAILQAKQQADNPYGTKQAIQAIAESLELKLMLHATQTTGQLPGNSPSNHPKLGEFNGLTKGIEWFTNANNAFEARGLAKILIYDNLCYHNQNRLGEITDLQLFGHSTKPKPSHNQPPSTLASHNQAHIASIGQGIQSFFDNVSI